MDGMKKRFSDIFELSPEVVLDLPLIMLVGQHKLYIENHNGISRYNDNEIKVRIKTGFIVITGNEMIIEEIKIESLTISGMITGICYQASG